MLALLGFLSLDEAAGAPDRRFFLSCGHKLPEAEA